MVFYEEPKLSQTHKINTKLQYALDYYTYILLILNLSSVEYMNNFNKENPSTVRLISLPQTKPIRQSSNTLLSFNVARIQPILLAYIRSRMPSELNPSYYFGNAAQRPEKFDMRGGQRKYV